MFRPGHFAMGMFSLGLAAFLAWGAFRVAVDHLRSGDFDQWIDQPGILESLALRTTTGGDSKDFYVECRYRYEVDGRNYLGTTFDHSRPGFASAEHAKAYVGRELDLVGKIVWRREDRQDGVVWVLEPVGLAVTVSRSPRDPSKATLTATPPESSAVTWGAVAVLALLALIFAPIGVALILPDRRGED